MRNRHRFLFAALFLFLLALLHGIAHASEAGNRAATSYGNVPLSFEANRGQTDPQVEFLSRGTAYTLFLTRSGETVLQLRGHGHASHGALLGMKIVGADRRAIVQAQDELPGKANYFIGRDPAGWHTNVPTYGKVRYKDIYPGVDLVYYGNQRQLEYDFIVSPQIDLTSITIKFEGAPVEVNSAGDLVLHSDAGDVYFRRPIAYQVEEGGKQKHFINSRFVQRGSSEVGFQIAAYDRTQPLVIDPVLVYSTYLGGSFPDQPLGIAVDSSGSAYVTGITCSADFPVTTGAFQTTHKGSGGACPTSQNSFEDVFVTKLNPTGTGLVYSTYIGGSNSDRGYDIAIDSNGNAYIAGQTQSADYPVTPGAMITTCPGGVGGCNTGLVTKLNSTGSALVYSTYLGGTGNMGCTGIAVNSSDEAYVTGSTDQTFPTTATAFQTTNPRAGAGLAPVFAVLNSAGTAAVYATFLGGSKGSSFNPGSQAFGVAIDSLGLAYITGWTDSSDFPVTAGAFQTKCGTDGLCNGLWDAFVSKLDPTKSGASSLVYSTFLGGSGTDIGFGIAVDASGSAYVTGVTGAKVNTQFTGSALPSLDFPTTAGAFQSTCPGSCTSDSAWVTKLNPSGTGLVYSTYLGASGNTNVGPFSSIVLDSSLNAYVAGFTAAADFPTQNATQSTYGGGTYDGFVTELNAAGSGLVFSTYLGGSSSDLAVSIALGPFANPYVTGTTSSTDFPHTAGAFQTTCPGSCTFYHGFVTKMGQPAARLSPTSLTFGNVVIDTTSAARAVTLTNSGTGTLNIANIAASGNYAISSKTCGATLAAGARCTVKVTFTPPVLGSLVGTLTFTDNAPNSPQTVPLSGTGVLPATLMPATAKYAAQAVGTTSAAKTFTLVNNQTVTLNNIAISTTGDFAVSAKTCTTSLAAKAKCTISVTFTPTTTGTRTGTLSVSDSASNSPQTSNLSGTGK